MPKTIVENHVEIVGEGGSSPTPIFSLIATEKNIARAVEIVRGKIKVQLAPQAYNGLKQLLTKQGETHSLTADEKRFADLCFGILARAGIIAAAGETKVKKLTDLSADELRAQMESIEDLLGSRARDITPVYSAPDSAPAEPDYEAQALELFK